MISRIDSVTVGQHDSVGLFDWDPCVLTRLSLGTGQWLASGVVGTMTCVSTANLIRLREHCPIPTQIADRTLPALQRTTYQQS